jgi:hypothetical protein
MSKVKKTKKVEKTAAAIKAEKLQAGNKNPYLNPYRDESKYALGFEAMRGFRTKSKKAAPFTKDELVAACAEVGLKKDGVVVLMSPTKKSERGDCRGNRSAAGHVYYVERLAKKEGEPRQFKFAWRPEILPSLRDDLASKADTSDAGDESVDAEQAEAAEAAEAAEQVEAAEAAEQVEADTSVDTDATVDA